MQSGFEKFLQAKGYKVESVITHPEASCDLMDTLHSLCQKEGLTWNELENNVTKLITKYSSGGIAQHLNGDYHEVLRALKMLDEYMLSK